MDIETLNKLKDSADSATVELNTKVGTFYNNVVSGMPITERLKIAKQLPTCQAKDGLIKALKHEGLQVEEIPEEMKVGKCHSYEELAKMIEQMKALSDMFYLNVTHIGNHPFIEFTGLMNEYIKVCANALEAGIDFSECNTHKSFKLPMEPFEKAYINEKLECIFTGDFELM